MKREEQADILLSLCNHALLGKGAASVGDVASREWDGILYFASLQGVLPVIWPLLVNLRVDDERSRMKMVRWYAAAQDSMQQYQLKAYMMQELVAILAEAGIDVMFMKGAALAQLYPKPEWRAFSDIDFYLYGKTEQGVETMTRHGMGKLETDHHHVRLSLNGVLLENHYNFVERTNHRCNVVLDDTLKALAESEGRSARADFIKGSYKNAYVMTPTMNAIFLMRHMSTHFASETISLRMLYDWALFLREHGEDVDWKMVTGLYENSGMSLFAGIIQRLLLSHLESDCKACPIAPGSKELAEKVWKSIIYPPSQDPYQEGSPRYYLSEARTFLANRWKYKMAYPDESYTLLMFKYAWLGIRKMTGLLKTEK